MEDQIKYRQSQGLENPSNSQLSAKISDQYSNTSRKRVGSIMVKKNNAQNSDEQQLYMKQVGKIKRGSYSSNRNYTEPLHIQEQNEVQYKNKLMKMKSDLKKINSNDLANKLNSRALHSRNKSYLQQKLELQKQLHNVLTKRSKLEQLQTKKIRLRAKLSELQFKLSEIKDAKQINKISLGLKSRDIDTQNTFDQKNPQAQANLTKKLKKPKLRPLPLNLRKPIESKIKLNTQPNLNNRGESDEQETIDYYYPAQLNHKCLNCKHFALKVEDVGLSNERIDQIIQVIKQGP